MQLVQNVSYFFHTFAKFICCMLCFGSECWALTNSSPSSLMDSIVNPKVKTTERKRVGSHSLARNTSRGKGACWSFEMGLGRLVSNSLTHMDLHKPNNKLVSA